MDKYNKEFASSEVTPKSLWGRFFDYFKPLSRPWCDGPQWTMTHGFFIQMGGFLLFENEEPKEVLDYDRLAELVRKKSIDRPTVTERELQDRSKGDTISKAVVVGQTTWFALQCCARLSQRLPLSELEVVTLAFTVVNVTIYAAWWDKPQSVDTAVRFQLKAMDKTTSGKPRAPTSDDLVDHIDQNRDTPQPTNGLYSAERQVSNDASKLGSHTAFPNDYQSLMNNNRPIILQGEPDKELGWLRRELHADRQQHSLPIFLLFFVPVDIIGSLLRPLSKMDNSDELDRKRLRVPMFYAAKNSSNLADHCLAAMGLIFAAIHFIAWNLAFLSRLDQVLWRCAAIVLIALPPTWFLAVILFGKSSYFEQDAPTRVMLVLHFVVGCAWFLSVLLYTPARLVVIVLAFKAVRQPPDGVLQDVSWTSFIPHL